MSTLESWKKQYLSTLKTLYSPAEINRLFEILGEEFLGLSPIALRLHAHENLTLEKEQQFLQTLSALQTGKPYQQILGKAPFFGLEFKVNEHTLIPRPETEELVELVLNKISPKAQLAILDIGTGSGCIAITLAKKLENAKVSALDISADTLAMAKQNALLNQVSINFIQANFLEEKPHQSYDLIVSNPPYIGQNEAKDLEVNVRNFEPEAALFSPVEDALIFYKKIAENLPLQLKEKGYLFLEINQKLGRETLALFKDKLHEVHLLKDLSGNDRLIWGKK